MLAFKGAGLNSPSAPVGSRLQTPRCVFRASMTVVFSDKTTRTAACCLFKQKNRGGLRLCFCATTSTSTQFLLKKFHSCLKFQTNLLLEKRGKQSNSFRKDQNCSVQPNVLRNSEFSRIFDRTKCRFFYNRIQFSFSSNFSTKTKHDRTSICRHRSSSDEDQTHKKGFVTAKREKFGLTCRQALREAGTRDHLTSGGRNTLSMLSAPERTEGWSDPNGGGSLIGQFVVIQTHNKL